MLVKTDFAVGFTTRCTEKAGYFKLFVSVFSAETVIHKHFVPGAGAGCGHLAGAYSFPAPSEELFFLWIFSDMFCNWQC